MATITSSSLDDSCICPSSNSPMIVCRSERKNVSYAAAPLSRPNHVVFPAFLTTSAIAITNFCMPANVCGYWIGNCSWYRRIPDIELSLSVQKLFSAFVVVPGFCGTSFELLRPKLRQVVQRVASRGDHPSRMLARRRSAFLQRTLGATIERKQSAPAAFLDASKPTRIFANT